MLFIFVVFNPKQFTLVLLLPCHTVEVQFFSHLSAISSHCFLQHLSSEENCPSTHSSQSDSQYGSPPRGWSEELDEHGHTLYVSEYTNEKVLERAACIQKSLFVLNETQSNRYFLFGSGLSMWTNKGGRITTALTDPAQNGSYQK